MSTCMAEFGLRIAFIQIVHEVCLHLSKVLVASVKQVNKQTTQQNLRVMTKWA